MYRTVYLLCFISVVHIVNSKVSLRNEKSDGAIPEADNKIENLTQGDNCWIDFKVKNFFNAMDKLDDKYSSVRKAYHKSMTEENFDEKMLETLLQKRGAADRAIHKVGGDATLIPAGINLGGYTMMKIKDNILFFHRMKLRNNTIFRMVEFKNDFTDMVLKAKLDLHDLHLFGSFHQAGLVDSPYVMYYTPTFGQVEFLMKNVRYNMEGRYRLLDNRLKIELIVSEIEMDDVLMEAWNTNKTASTTSLRQSVSESFVWQLKNDLNRWMKDYFNDYLMYFITTGDSKFQSYEAEKTLLLNDYTDEVIDIIIKQLQEINATTLKMAPVSILAVNGLEFHLSNGQVHGLTKMFRRSVGTGGKDGDIRKVEAIVGFSTLKATYKYDVVLTNDVPPLSGVLVYTADDASALMAMSMVKEPETMDLHFDFLEHTKPESLTIEGPANKMLSNFQYLLEQHIISVLSNSIITSIKYLGSISRCVPFLPSYFGQDEKLENHRLQKQVAGFKETTETSVNKQNLVTEQNSNNTTINEKTPDDENDPDGENKPDEAINMDDKQNTDSKNNPDDKNNSDVKNTPEDKTKPNVELISGDENNSGDANGTKQVDVIDTDASNKNIDGASTDIQMIIEETAEANETYSIDDKEKDRRRLLYKSKMHKTPQHRTIQLY